MWLWQPCVQAPATCGDPLSHAARRQPLKDVTWHVQEQPGFFGREYEQANLRMKLEQEPASILVRRLLGLHAARLLPVIGTMCARIHVHGAKPTAQRS